MIFLSILVVVCYAVISFLILIILNYQKEIKLLTKLCASYRDLCEDQQKLLKKIKQAVEKAEQNAQHNDDNNTAARGPRISVRSTDAVTGKPV